MTPCKMVSKQLLFSLLLAAAMRGQPQEINSNTNSLSFVDFPADLQPRVEWEAHMFVSPNVDRVVDFRVFQIFPEPPDEEGLPSQRIWPVLEGMTKRMDGILWPRVHYYMEQGEDYGCRAPLTKSGGGDGESESDTFLAPVKTEHCERHCTHGGRYCAPQTESLPSGKYGKDVIHESLRRMCLDNHYHTTDGRFFRYLEEFEQRSCFAHNDTRSCSHEAMAQSGTNHEKLEKCLREDSWEKDEPHEILDRNLYHFTNNLYQYSRHTMPQIEINGLPIMPNDYGKEIRLWSPKFIFDNYCQKFPHDLALPHEGQTLACEVCAPCQDVGTCLWTLECDGVLFDHDKWAKHSLKAYPIALRDDSTNAVATQQPTTNEESPANTKGENVVIVEESEDQGGRIFLIILLVVCVVVIPVCCVCYRKRRHTRHLADIISKTMRQGNYHDEAYSYSGENPVPSWKIARSVRNGENTNIAPRPTEDGWNLEAELNDIAIDGEVSNHAFC